jgi:hypothetical protein
MAEVLKLAPNGHAPDKENLVKHLREIVDWVEAGDYGDVRNVYVLVETLDGTLNRNTCGLPCDRARLIGIFSAMAARLSIGD